MPMNARKKDGRPSASVRSTSPGSLTHGPRSATYVSRMKNDGRLDRSHPERDRVRNSQERCASSAERCSVDSLLCVVAPDLRAVLDSD